MSFSSVWAIATCVAPLTHFFSELLRILTIKQSALIGKCQLTDSYLKTLNAKEWLMSTDSVF